MSYFTYSLQLLGVEFQNSENNIHPLNRLINEGNERNVKLLSLHFIHVYA